MYKGDEFLLQDEDTGKSFILVFSGKSGNDYQIDDEGCSCKGYSIRGTCRHIKGAEETGLLQKMNAQHYQKALKESRKSLEKSLSEFHKVADKFCRGCGTEFDEDDNYCGCCGKKRKRDED
jgi:hypothetical protein